MRGSLFLMSLFALVACDATPSASPRAASVPAPEVVSLSRDAAVEPAVEREAPQVSVVEAPVEVPEASSLDVIAEAPEPLDGALATFVLRRGETPAHFARWSGFPVEVIAELSGIALDGSYDVGTELRLPIDGEDLADVVSKRDAHWHKRVDGYLASRGGAVGTEFYEVRTGDSAWTIATRAHGFPVWVLEAYNPSVDLDRLRPGQALMVPVLADITVDADTDPME